jgi:hypothetical protein
VRALFIAVLMFGCGRIGYDGLNSDAADTAIDAAIIDATPAIDAAASVSNAVRLTSQVVGDSYEPDIVWTGSEYGLVWTDSQLGNPQIYFARLDASGAMIGGDLRLSQGAARADSPRIAWNGTEFAVAWEDERDLNAEIYFARVDAAGNKIGNDTRVSVDDSQSADPRIAWNGNDWGIIWPDRRSGLQLQLYFARMSALGVEIGDDVRVTLTGEDAARPSIQWTGSEYAVSWMDSREGENEVYLALLDQSGANLSGDLRITAEAGASAFPEVAWTGSHLGFAWRDNRDGNLEVFFARTSPAGAKIGQDLQITDVPGDDIRLSLAWMDGAFGVVWHDTRDLRQQIYFAPLGPDGTRLDADLLVSNGPAASIQPATAWTGTELGIVWSDNRDDPEAREIYFARVTP